jgi:hypothetical protein
VEAQKGEGGQSAELGGNGAGERVEAKEDGGQVAELSELGGNGPR